VVGLMMSHVLSLSDAGALRNAAHLGIAMQMTNICRDVREDWDRGRLYLPLDVLADCGGPGLDAQLGSALPVAARVPVRRAVHRLLDQADRYYASADRGVSALSPRCALCVRTARLVYAEIGTCIAARGYDPLAGRAVVPLRRKVELLGRAIASLAVEAPPRLMDGFHSVKLETVVRYPDDVLPC